MKKIKELVKNILFKILSSKKGYSDLTVLTGQAKGTVLRINLKIEGSYFLGTYDKWIFDRIDFSKYIKPGMIVWDGGAYIGYYTSVFRKCLGETGEIFTFEASLKNYNIVKILPQLNNWSNVNIINLAIGTENSKIKFVNNLGGSNGPLDFSKKYDSEVEVIEVDCKGVDEIINLKIAKEPDFIKFDLESAEVFALHNGDNLFKNKKPLILLELHGNEAFLSAGLFLEKYNYEAAYVGDFPIPKRWYKNQIELNEMGFIPHMIFCRPIN